VVLDESDHVDCYQVGPTLEYVKKWPPHLWPHAFFGMLHIIPQRDFNFIEAELRRAGKDSPRSGESNGATVTDVLAYSSPVTVDPTPKKFSVARKSRKSSYRRRSTTRPGRK
jgi:hypothetical protein